MTILILHSELGVLRGGGENFTKNLFKAFAKRSHRASAAFVANWQSNYPFPLPREIEPIPLPGWWSRNLGQGALSAMGRVFPEDAGFRKKWDYLQEAISWRTIRFHNRRFRDEIERTFKHRWHQFDAIYVHGDPVLASQVARYRPTVLRLPGPVGPEALPDLRRINAVCANGDALLRIRQFLGADAIELPVGLDTNLFTPGPISLRSKLGWTDQDNVIGYVGRLNHLKGVDLLSAAFREIFKCMRNTRLLIIGSGEEEKNIRSDLQKELAMKAVHIEPDVEHEQLPEWYRVMDVLVMPSRYENFSNAILEAMACGVPFIGADVGGNRMLADTGAGALFEPESVHCLVECVMKEFKCSSQLKMRGRAGLDYVKNRHSWSVTAERVENIFVSSGARHV